MGADYEQGLKNELSAMQNTQQRPSPAVYALEEEPEAELEVEPEAADPPAPCEQCQPIRTSKSVYFQRNLTGPLGERSMSYSARRENYKQSQEFLQQTLDRIALLDYEDSDSATVGQRTLDG